MRIKTIILVAISASASLLTSCANHLELGVDAYNRGEYDKAAEHLDGLANSGNPSAQYHVGLLREGGLGSTPKNAAEAAQWYLRSAKQGYVPAMVRLANIQMAAGYEEQALSWYTLAARWGNDDAVTALTDLGRGVPPPDLLLEQQHYQGTVAAASRTGNLSSTCFSDSSCDIGFSCEKGRDKNMGMCRKTGPEYRFSTPPSIDSLDGIKPNTDLDGRCQLNTDCPSGFLCDRDVCVAR